MEITREEAQVIKEQCFKASIELNKIVLNPNIRDNEKNRDIKRGVGSCMGHIHMELLKLVYQMYPELDDFKDDFK